MSTDLPNVPPLQPRWKTFDAVIDYLEARLTQDKLDEVCVLIDVAVEQLKPSRKSEGRVQTC
jgi:hypothetical protein